MAAFILTALAAKSADAPPPVFKAPTPTNAIRIVDDNQKVWNNGQPAPTGLWPGQHPVAAEWYVAPAPDSYSVPQANYPAQYSSGDYRAQPEYSSITSYGSDSCSGSAGFSRQGVFSRPAAMSRGCFNQYNPYDNCQPVTTAGFSTRVSFGGSVGGSGGFRHRRR